MLLHVEICYILQDLYTQLWCFWSPLVAPLRHLPMSQSLLVPSTRTVSPSRQSPVRRLVPTPSQRTWPGLNCDSQLITEFLEVAILIVKKHHEKIEIWNEYETLLPVSPFSFLCLEWFKYLPLVRLHTQPAMSVATPAVRSPLSPLSPGASKINGRYSGGRGWSDFFLYIFLFGYETDIDELWDTWWLFLDLSLKWHICVV